MVYRCSQGHLNCVEIRCSETRIQDPRRSTVQTEVEAKEAEKGDGSSEGKGGRFTCPRRFDRVRTHYRIFPRPSIEYNGKMEGRRGLGRGRKFANFRDRARIISGWLGGFLT